MKLVVSVGLWSQAQTSTKFSNFISSDSSANQKTKWLAAVDEFNQIYVWKFELTDKEGFHSHYILDVQVEPFNLTVSR